MRNLIDLIESNEIIDEECVEHDRIFKGTWTEWQDRDVIALVHPGSNSVYVGFCNQKEAEDYAAGLGEKWRVLRNGRYKEVSDAEAQDDPEIRRKRRLYGFYLQPLSHQLSESEICDPSPEDIRKVIDELDAEGDIKIMTRSWKRSYILQKMIGDDAWERWLCAEVKKLNES